MEGLEGITELIGGGEIEMNSKGIKVVILCGGMGTRLREETDYKPKPMVAIGDKPILWHIMKMYSAYAFKEFVLCLGYKGETIKSYFHNYEIINNDFTVELGRHKHIEFHGNHDEEGWRITLVDTGDSALKGCRIKRIEKYVDGDIFMLTYGDGVADIDLQKLLAFHESHGRIGTVTGVRPPSRFGEMVTNDNQVTSFTEKPQVSAGLINGGFFVFNRKIFDYLSVDEDCDFEKGALEKLAGASELMVYEHPGDWACMDTFRDMQYLNKLWHDGMAFWKAGE
jgi:glucose-1-phosphate cytidylyltransferase